MKVQARYKKKGLNPFKPVFSNDDFYRKTVEVADDFDWDMLKQFAIEDTSEGYEFIAIEKID